MIYYLILIISTLIATSKALICKVLGSGNTTKKDIMLLNFKTFFVAFLCSLIFVINDSSQLFSISTFSIVLSILFAVSVTVTQIFQMKAMGKGPASIVTLVLSSAFLIPIIYSLFALDESVSIAQWGGIALLAVSLVLSIGKKEDKRALKSWLPASLIAMMCSGISAIIQKNHQSSVHSDEIYAFLVCCLFFSTVFTAVAYLLTSKVDKKKETTVSINKEKLRRFILPLSLGVCVVALNYFNLMLSGKLPSVIHFPTYNVGSLLLVSVISFIIFKEKMKPIQKIGFSFGVISILIIGLL